MNSSVAALKPMTFLVIYRFQIDLLLLVYIYILDSVIFEKIFYLASFE